MLVRNNITLLNVFVKVHLLVHYISKQQVAVYFIVHNSSLPPFAPIFIYILFSPACTIE